MEATAITAPTTSTSSHFAELLTPPDFASDTAVAAAAARLLMLVPCDIEVHRAEFPLLGAMRRSGSLDLRRVASALIILASAIHTDADERRVAEYLLRHRAELASGRRSPCALIRAARFAAEMDVRRTQLREVPVEQLTMPLQTFERDPALDEAPSVADVVSQLLERVASPSRLNAPALEHVRDGVLAVFELAERHRLNGGTGPALLAMRPAARRDARLVTRLQSTFVDPSRARAVSRLLIGSDGTSLDTALLWWAARGASADVEQIPRLVRRRWQRDLGLITGRATSQPSSVA